MRKMLIDEAFLGELETLETLLKNHRAGMFGGNRRTKKFGSSCEFADYRDYMPGDDVTKIDWNIYARSDKLYEKLYLDERQMHTKIYVDASRSMNYGDEEKADTALRLAAAFAYISVAEMDKVSIYAIHGDTVEELISGMVGKDAYVSSINKLNELEFYGDANISAALSKINLGMGDGYSVIISDFFGDYDLEYAINLLAEKKRDILAIQVLAREELNPQLRGKMHLFDAESADKFFRKKIDKEIVRAYKEALKFVTERIKRAAQSRGGEYILVPAYASVSDVFFGELADLGVLK